MKKYSKLIFIFVLFFCLTLSSVFSHGVNFAKAEEFQSQTIETLIGTNITASDYTNVYGGLSSNELSNFTPFNKETSSRLPGKSIVPTTSENNTINSFSLNLLENGGANINTDKLAIGMWIYFSGTIPHTLTIKFIVDEENYYRVQVSRDDLKNMLYNAARNKDEPAYAWNYFEFPIHSAYITGSIIDGEGNLKKLSKMELSYSHANIDSQSQYAGIKIYGADIITTQNNNVNISDKQDYSIYSFNFWDADQLSSMIIGDKLSIGSLSSIVNYAWVGEINLLSLTGVRWTMVVSSPSGKNYTYNLGAGDEINFDEEGRYTVFVRAYKETGDFIIDLSDFIKIDVQTNKLSRFLFNTYMLKSDEVHIITLVTSSLLDENTVVIESIIYDDKIISVEQLDTSNQLKVTAKKGGVTEIEVKLSGRRHGYDEANEYTAKTTIKVAESEQTSIAFQIFLWCLLGVIVIFGIVCLVKSRIESRKDGVK